METDGHDAICGKEGLFHSISMVNIDIDVKNSLMVLEQFQDGQHDVIHVAKSFRLLLFCMVQSTGPINAKITAPVIQFDGGVNWSAAWYLRKFEESWEPWAVIFAYVELIFVLL